MLMALRNELVASQSIFLGEVLSEDGEVQDPAPDGLGIARGLPVGRIVEVEGHPTREDLFDTSLVLCQHGAFVASRDLLERFLVHETSVRVLHHSNRTRVAVIEYEVVVPRTLARKASDVYTNHIESTDMQ